MTSLIREDYSRVAQIGLEAIRSKLHDMGHEVVYRSELNDTDESIHRIEVIWNGEPMAIEVHTTDGEPFQQYEWETQVPTQE